MLYFAAATGAGAIVLHAPREWPEYHPGYYAAFVRDPDGNNVEAACRRPPPDYLQVNKPWFSCITNAPSRSMTACAPARTSCTNASHGTAMLASSA